MGQFKEGQGFRVTKLNGILSWKSWDNVSVNRRGEQLAPGECLILVEECIHDGGTLDGESAGVWKALTRYGMRYFLYTTLKTGAERL